MESIKILWLYDDLLDLYGDGGNLTILQYHLDKAGIRYQIERKSIHDDLVFDGCRMVYIGPGKINNLLAAAKHFHAYGSAVKKAVSDGVVFLIIGNARFLLGQNIQAQNGKSGKGIGLFDYDGIDTGDVEISDVISAPAFASQELCYGFINRTGYLASYQNDCPLFQLKQGLGDTQTKADVEGNHFHNLFATWQLGPLLVKNPFLLETILRLLVGRTITIDDRLEKRAYEETMIEFKKLR